MSQTFATPGAVTTGTITPRTSEYSTRATRRLLGCGIVSGPAFAATVAIQVLTRDGYDLTRHPISMLSLGELGWIQIVNFVLAGLLSIAFAVGMRRVLHPGRAGTWGPVLFGVFGLGMIIGGVFVTDPSLGFPAGAPAGMPTETSWHARVHDIAPGLALDAMVIACFVFVRRFAGLRQRGLQVYSASTAVAVIVLTCWPSLDGISVRLAVAMALVLAWMTAIAVHLRHRLAQPSS